MSIRNHYSTPRLLRSERGLTLVELMISMALGLLLVSTIGYAYVGAKASFRTQNALARIQEGARYAFEFMGEDIRMAGYTGGPSDDAKIFQTAGWDKSLNDLKMYPLFGYENSGPAWAAPTSGDALTVVHADTEREYNLNAQTATTVTLATGSAAVNDYMVVSDYSNAAAAQVTAVAAGVVTFAAGLGGTFSGDLTSRKAYPLSGVTYYVDNNPAGEPALYRYRLATGAAEELVEGVSDMQITYGVDTSDNMDRSVDAYVDAGVITADTGNIFQNPANTDNGDVDTDRERWLRVMSVRIVLTMISRQNDFAVESSDRRLRKTVTMTIAVRNRLQ